MGDSVESAKKELEFHFPTKQNTPRSTKEYTLAMIKPDAVSAGKAGEIVNRIKYEGFVVVEQEGMKLTKERAEAFYAEHKGKGFFGELVEFMVSGPIYALKLGASNAILKWRSLMGPTNFETAKQEAPQSIRALYASSMTKNASHGSDSVESAKRELEFYFPTKQNSPRSTKEFTLAMIKPDAVSAGKATEIVNRIKYEGFVVVEQEEMKLDKDRAEAFYAEHKGKGFFGELVEFMKFERENAIKTWRTVMGPTNFEVAKEQAPDSVR